MTMARRRVPPVAVRQRSLLEEVPMIRTLMLAALFTFTAGTALTAQASPRKSRADQTIKETADAAKEPTKAKRERKQSKKKVEGEMPRDGRAR
jgi:hypothetical protein